MDYLDGFIGSTATINSRKWGPLTVEAVSFTPATDGDLVVQIGRPFEQQHPLIRIHSECIFAQALDSDLCDCADQLQIALQHLTQEGHGLLIYLRFDGRGAGLAAKVKATALEVQGIDTYESRMQIGVPPESRDFKPIAQYLRQKSITSVRLLTNNPLKGNALEKAGIRVAQIPLLVDTPDDKVRNLYRTKARKFGHIIPAEFQ